MEHTLSANLVQKQVFILYIIVVRVIRIIVILFIISLIALIKSEIKHFLKKNRRSDSGYFYYRNDNKNKRNDNSSNAAQELCYKNYDSSKENTAPSMVIIAIKIQLLDSHVRGSDNKLDNKTDTHCQNK